VRIHHLRGLKFIYIFENCTVRVKLFTLSTVSNDRVDGGLDGAMLVEV
jgi:hypothetical protein